MIALLVSQHILLHYITFSHLAEAFIQSDLQMRTIKQSKPTKEQ